jgi:hypothetical protein
VIDGDGVGAICLNLDRISTRQLGGFNNAKGTVDVTVVVSGHLGNDVRRLGRAYATPGDAQSRLPNAWRSCSPCCVLPFHKATPVVLVIKKVSTQDSP